MNQDFVGPDQVGTDSVSTDPLDTDPFDTARLRQSVLAAWSSSPTRFREDANAEEDLRLGSYRDRLLVELAQNAADAAGTRGFLRVSVVNGELRAANTGTPLDAPGVTALASLRASAKRGAETVGQFGVGFAAVLAVTDEPSVVSTTGSVAFSARRTSDAVAGLPGVAEQAAARAGQVPVLRLPWAVAESPPPGFATEVRLPLRSDVDGEALLAEFRAQAGDLLLALPGLSVIDIDGLRWSREDDSDGAGGGEAGGTVTVRDPGGVTRWLVHRESGELAARQGLGVEASPRWTVCWAVPLDPDGVPQPLGEDVLHIPTPTDERMSLPARLIASLPVEPSRRRVRPGPASDEVLTAAGNAYVRLIASLPDEHRADLVPPPGFPLSEVDDRVRGLVARSLRGTEWLPAAAGGYAKTAGACVLDTPSVELVELLRDVVSGLLTADMSQPRHAAALGALDVGRLRPADIVEAVTGIERDPAWWRRLYSALTPLADADPKAREELGALPVPLVDGRTLPGPRGVLLADEDTVEDLSDVDVPGLRVAHPDAAHPLLERLGAHPADATELLDSDALRDAVERAAEDAAAGLDVTALAEAVLHLVARAGGRDWLGALPLPDGDGQWRRADELVLPGSALWEVLAPEGPLGSLDADFAARWQADVLAAVGVLDSFAVVVDEEPTGPDHDLDDEANWWAGAGEPARVVAVRDLDLVADDAWPAALRLLAADPAAWRALREPGGYTGWWLARHAKLDGQAPRQWRLADATGLTGLYDPMPELGLTDELAAMIGVRTGLEVGDADDALELVVRLGDPRRSAPPGVFLRAHAVLAEAVRDELVMPADVDAPSRVRTLSGEAVAAGECAVLDGPWLLGVLSPDRVVAAFDGLEPDAGLAEPLADLLDLPLASETVGGEVSVGERVAWRELGAVVQACELMSTPVPDGAVEVHDELTVDGHRVPWWVDAGLVHAEDSPDGLARALAWTLDRWADRHLIMALLEDTDPTTLLG